MRSSFAARRKARVVGQCAPDYADGNVPLAGDSSDEQGKPAPAVPVSNSSNNPSPSSQLTTLAERTPVVKRPTIAPRASSKKSSLRLSFNPGETPTASLDSSIASEVFTPKKSNLSRRAIEKNALRKSLAPPSASHLPLRPPDDRPSYTASALSELRNSTPSTPKDLHSLSDTETEPSSALDIASKFGSDLVPQAPISSIPTESEIREKKERRARLAREQDFIHLSSTSTTSTSTISLLPSKPKPSSRLAHDDENLLEDSDQFVSDGTLALGRKAEIAQRHRHALEMRDLIQAASASASDSPDSESDRHAAYEAAQTRFGMDGLHKPPRPGSRRPKTPPRVTPLPQLSACLERLQSTLRRVEDSRAGMVRRAEAVEREMVEIAAREVEIQRLLKEAGEAYERLRAGAGGEERGAVLERGLESLGHTLTGMESGGEG